MELNVAVIGGGVGVISALYARWAGVEAKRANEINLLSRRVEIYDAYIHLKMHMFQKRGSAQLSEVSIFYIPL